MEDYSTYPHNSIFGGLNMLKIDTTGHVLDRGVRPPYPIIISNPTVIDCIRNLNKADLGIILSGIPVAFLGSRWVVREYYGSEYIKRRLYSSTFKFIMFLFSTTALFNSGYRLAGLVDNGLVWKRR